MNKKILITVPIYKDCHTETFNSIWNLEIPEGYEVDLRFFKGYGIDTSRNLAKMAVAMGGYDYQFTVDGDMSFPPDTLKRLLALDADIATGLCFMKENDPLPCVFDYCPGEHKIFQRIVKGEVRNRAKNGPFEIGGCGFGVVLIKRSVYDKITEDFVYSPYCGEDLKFCWRAQELGLKIMLDPEILCGHWGDHCYQATLEYPVKR